MAAQMKEAEALDKEIKVQLTIALFDWEGRS